MVRSEGASSPPGPRTRAERPEREAFAARLRLLRLACGNPSYAALRRGSALLPPATLSDALRARVTPRLEFVTAYVQVCLSYAAERALTVEHELADLADWRRRWQRVRSESDAARRGSPPAAADLPDGDRDVRGPGGVQAGGVLAGGAPVGEVPAGGRGLAADVLDTSPETGHRLVGGTGDESTGAARPGTAGRGSTEGAENADSAERAEGPEGVEGVARSAPTGSTARPAVGVAADTRPTPAPWQLPNPVRRLYGRDREMRWLDTVLLHGGADSAAPGDPDTVGGAVGARGRVADGVTGQVADGVTGQVADGVTGQVADGVTGQAADAPGAGEGDEAIQPRSSPIAVLEGLGGVGKTAVALCWGHRHRQLFPDGQLFTDLSGFGPGAPADPAHVLADFVRALGASARMVSNETQALSALFRTLCSDRRMLIVLDNAADAEQVRPLLPAAPGVAVLVTTRSAMAGLAVRDDARRLVVGPLGTEDAAALLTRDLPDADPDRVNRLAAACGNLPLALRLVSARWEFDPLDPVLEALTRRSPLDVDAQGLLSALADPDDRASDVAAVFSWSLSRCSAAERRALLLLSAAPSPAVDDFAAAALIGLPVSGARQLLSALADRHLLDRPVPGSWRMHDLVRVWVHGEAVRLLGQAQLADALDRVLGYYLYTADAVDRVLLPQRHRPPLRATLPRPLGMPRIGDRADALGWGDDRLGDLVDASASARDAGRHPFAATLPTILLSYLDLRKPWAQWLTLCRTGLASAAVLGDPEVSANLHVALGIVYRETHAVDAAIEAQHQAAEAFRAAGHTVGVAMALNNLGSVYNGAGRPAEARKALVQAVREMADSDDRYRRAIVLHNLAETEIALGEFDLALEHATAAMNESRAVGDDLGAATTRTAIGQIQLRLGRLEIAEREFRTALGAQRLGQDRLGEATTQRRLGRLLLDTGRPAEARAALTESLDILRELGDSDLGEVQALLTEAEAQSTGVRSGRRDEADESWGRSGRRGLLRRRRRGD